MRRDVLFERMHDMHMTQAELARRTGVSCGMICQLLAGKAGPSVALLKRICRVLDLRAEEVW